MAERLGSTLIDQNNQTCVHFSWVCAKVISKKGFKRKLTKACLNLELIAGKEISSGEGSLLTNILCFCADKNEIVVRKILADSKVKLFTSFG